MTDDAAIQVLEYRTESGHSPHQPGRFPAEDSMSDAAVPYEIGLYEDLTDPDEAAAYLNAALEDGDQEAFLLALRRVTEARGMSQVARQARLNRESLYRMLSPSGNPQLASLNALLRTVGLRLAVEVEQQRPTGVAVAEALAGYQAKAD